MLLSKWKVKCHYQRAAFIYAVVPVNFAMSSESLLNCYSVNCNQTM